MVAVVEEFGEQEMDVIPRADVEESLDSPGAEAFNTIVDGDTVGGAVVNIDGPSRRGSLDIMFMDVGNGGRGIGQKVWSIIEGMCPEIDVWETHTPYFERRNIHFYLNRCGFRIVEFFNPKHPDPHHADTSGGEYFFRFEKEIRR